MLRARQHRQQSMTGLSFEVLSSMVAELVDHHQRQGIGNEIGFDWESPSARTKVVRYGASNCLAGVLSQEPDAVAKEYQLSYGSVLIFTWHEYRWPHLQSEAGKVSNEDYIDLPQNCIDELMDYHITMKTSWLFRYRANKRKSCLGSLSTGD